VGRVVVKSGSQRCTFKFSDEQDLKRVLNAVALVASDNVEVVVLLERDGELGELTKALNPSFKVAKVTLKPTGMQEVAIVEQPGSDVDEERVYEVVKRLVAEKLKRREQYLPFRELHVQLFGRELNLRDWRDDKLARRLKRALKHVLQKVGNELGVQFEEVTVREYNGRTGRFKAYRIVPVAKVR